MVSESEPSVTERDSLEVSSLLVSESETSVTERDSLEVSSSLVSESEPSVTERDSLEVSSLLVADNPLLLLSVATTLGADVPQSSCHCKSSNGNTLIENLCYYRWLLIYREILELVPSKLIYKIPVACNTLAYFCNINITPHPMSIREALIHPIFLQYQHYSTSYEYQGGTNTPYISAISTPLHIL